MSSMANTYNPDYAVHPGEYLEEVLESRNISKGDFARRCGLTAKTISQIINQKVNFSTEVAIQFEQVLGISAEIWIGMLNAYQLYESRQRELTALDNSYEWAKQFPLSDLRKLGIVSRSGDRATWTRELLSFFNVSSPESWNAVYREKAIVYRKSPTLVGSEYAVATWLRIAETRASKIATDKYRIERTKEILPELRALTIAETSTFQVRMIELCGTAGIALVVVPELKGTRISGAAEWLSSETALIALSLRHKSDDHLWFTFFHEIGHLILHGRKQVFVDNDDHNEDAREQEANRFSRDLLIPPKAYREFTERGKFYPSDITGFAAEIGIAPGIVVGALQHDGHIQYSWHNGLKRRFEFVVNDSEISA